ncbi:hypothetical protein EJ377_03425 [Chryseobacterium arthrosphaerae]|uniref:Gingipain domain-containing protein n=1 Tax=Chryseobacterium arthrosphaerae TaxID=651561 RepID=A0A3S0N4S0_9FLAO|nr:hypothetical protein EJ377_03425 [Chryseobacterium arthrosphaerae]
MKTFTDIPVGRIPATNASEAGDMINKTLAYYNALPDSRALSGIGVCGLICSG